MNKITQHLLAAVLVSGSISPVFALKNNYADTSFKIIKHDFKHNNAWGLHTTIDLHGCDPELIRSREVIQEYIIKLCDLIKMKRFRDPVIVHFGENERVAGFSMAQLIETSLVSGHFANASNSAYIDIFSCNLYNPYVAIAFTKEFFKAKKVTINVLLRK